jgi:hypothetical protein
MTRLIMSTAIAICTLQSATGDSRVGTVRNVTVEQTAVSEEYSFSAVPGQAGIQRQVVQVPKRKVRETYVIDSAGQRFVGVRTSIGEHKLAGVPAMAEVKFEVSKKHIHIVDESGERHSFSLSK